ncbi:MAG: hypothetical protein ACK5MM_03075 [Planctomyces sp.]
MKGISMRDRGRSFFRCQSGAVVSAELVVVGTMVVIGLITGLSAVQNSINSELLDLSSAFNALDQSYGFTGYEAVSRTRRLAWTAPSSWYDTDEQASDRPLQMRALEPRSEGPVRGGQPSGQAPRGNRGAGGGSGGPGAARVPPARGTGRGGPDAEAATGDEQAEGGNGEVLPSDELRAAGEWQTTQYAPAPDPGAQYPGPQPQVGYAGPVYYTWQGAAPVYPSEGWQSPDSYYSPWFEGYRRYSLGGREMITHVRGQRISEWPLSPWPGQNGWLSSPEQYAAPRARFVPGPRPVGGSDAGAVHQHPGVPSAFPGVPLQPGPGAVGPVTPPPPIPDGNFGSGGPMTPPPPVPHAAAVRPHRPQPEIMQATHSAAPVGRYQVPRQSRLYNAPSWYVAPPNAHEPRFPEYVW